MIGSRSAEIVLVIGGLPAVPPFGAAPLMSGAFTLFPRGLRGKVVFVFDASVRVAALLLSALTAGSGLGGATGAFVRDADRVTGAVALDLVAIEI